MGLKLELAANPFYESGENIHKNLLEPTQNGTSHLVKGTYKYYHYGCDGFIDMGWGCGYRTLQSICSWMQINIPVKKDTPSIPEIQKILVDMEDKPNSFLGSKEWIGSVEVCLVIDKLYDIPCKIVHVKSGRDLSSYVNQLVQHFESKGCPIMMGGDRDCSSKGIMGIHVGEENSYLLIVDPHFVGTPKSCTQLQNDSWVKWQKLSDFLDSSFYNFCIPQCTITQ